LHDFHEILAVAMGAVPCKGQGSVDMGLFAKAKEPFLRGFLKLENGVPAMPPQSLPKGSRLFRRLDPERFLAAFQRFMTGFSKTTHENGPHNLAVLRNMALNGIQKDGGKGSLRGEFKRADWAS
jgi:hypothetical protein